MMSKDKNELAFTRKEVITGLTSASGLFFLWWLKDYLAGPVAEFLGFDGWAVLLATFLLFMAFTIWVLVYFVRRQNDRGRR